MIANRTTYFIVESLISLRGFLLVNLLFHYFSYGQNIVTYYLSLL